MEGERNLDMNDGTINESVLFCVVGGRERWNLKITRSFGRFICCSTVKERQEYGIS